MRRLILILALAAGCRGARTESPSESPSGSGTVSAPTTPASPARPAGSDASEAKSAVPSAPGARQASSADVDLPRFAGGDLPVYPELSIRLQEEGIVELEFQIRENGSVREVSIAKSSGFERLDAAGLAAARTWRFNPTTGGGDVETVRYRLQFRLVEQ